MTEFPFLRSREDWRLFHVLRHLAVRDLLPEVGDKPQLFWEYYARSPPKLGEVDRGFYVPIAVREWTIRTSLHLLTLYEQREVRNVPIVRHKGFFFTTPVWWEQVEVPRGMAARVPQMGALQRSLLMGEPLAAAYLLSIDQQFQLSVLTRLSIATRFCVFTYAFVVCFVLVCT